MLDHFVTQLGCTVIVRTSEIPDAPQGVVLTLRMDQDGDGRMAQVFLNSLDVDALIELLMNTPQRRHPEDEVL